MHRRTGPRTLVAALLMLTGVVMTAIPGAAARRPGPSGVEATPVAEIRGVTALSARPGDPALWATTKAGLVVAVRPDGRPETALDLTGRVRDLGEGGLLGLAFSPDGTRLYLAHSDRPDGRLVVTAHTLAAPPATDLVDPDPDGRVVLSQPHPAINHFGGHLVTGPDGHLWIGLGDGGGDVAQSGPNARDPDTWLGKILRVDPTGGSRYSVPADNPYAAGGGRPEIAVIGMRNPWSFTFDPTTGALWVADVGQDSREEVDRIPAGRILGADLGWNVFEGRARYSPGSAPRAVPPLVELDHDDGYCAVVGGAVVRSAVVPALRDRYVFSDYCAGRLLSVDADARRPRVRDLGVTLSAPTGVAIGADGAVYVATLAQGIVRLDAA